MKYGPFIFDYCLWSITDSNSNWNTQVSSNYVSSNWQPTQSYQSDGMNQLDKWMTSIQYLKEFTNIKKIYDEQEAIKYSSDQVNNKVYSSANCAKPESSSKILWKSKTKFSDSQSERSWEFDDKDDHKFSNCINLDALKGHKYEIVHNPTEDKNESNYEYICKYSNWGKSFSKTYNLVYHFRVHTQEKPFQWEYWGKRFSQKGNLGRHLERHNTSDVGQRKVHTWSHCSKSYTSIYNLRVRLTFNNFLDPYQE